MVPGLHLIPAEEARRILAETPPVGTERVPLAEAAGRVLATELRAPANLPGERRAVMDGYAVRAADVHAASELSTVTLALVGVVPMGNVFRGAVAAGEAVAISTGGFLPEGADAIVMIEHTSSTAESEGVGRSVEIGRAVAPGANVIQPGEDLAAGAPLLAAGRRLRPQDLAVLATFGIVDLPVFRRPRVAVLSTGNELADLGTEPTAAQIPNANTYSLMAQIVEAGGLPLNLGVAPDRLDAIAERIARGMEADVLVSSAGVSVGELDLVREALVNAGAELHLWKVDMRPGKPITFGTLGDKPVFGLPGNPVSAMVTFELFVRPMLLAMQGRRGPARPTLRATALAPIVNRGSRRGYLRVTLEARDGRWGARLTGDQGSGILRSMVAADGLAVLKGDTTVAEGQEVEVIVLRQVSL